MDGFTLLEHLKRSPQPPAIIIVSGNADEEEARHLLQRGAFDYVMKPVDFGYLKQVIAAAAGAAIELSACPLLIKELLASVLLLAISCI